MSLLDDPKIKSKYQKCKYKVKRWESDFMEKYGRRPNKNNIRDADIKIKEAYKTYWELKTQALEETLLDITFSDEIGTNVSENSSFDKVLTSTNNENHVNKSNHPSPLKNIENIVPEASPLKQNSIVLNSPLKKDTTNVDGVWGDHLNKDNVAPKKEKRIPFGKSSSFQLSQNKFSSSSFAKRNPRKALSTSRLKSKSNQMTKSVDQIQSSSDVKIDEIIHDKQSLLGESIKIIHQDAKITSQPLNPIQELINGAPKIAERNINTGWLERCSENNNLEPITPIQKRLSGVSDSGIESVDLSEVNTSPEVNKDDSVVISDDDDFVCNSETEEESKSKRIRNWRKALLDNTNQPTKRLRTESTCEVNNSPLHNHLSSNNKDHCVLKVVDNFNDKLIESNEMKKSDNLTKRNDLKTIDETKQKAMTEIPARRVNVNDSNDEIKKPKTRKRVARVTRAKPQTTRNKKASRVVQKRKQAPVKRRVGRSGTKNVPCNDDDDDDDNDDDEVATDITQSPEIPIYSVESLEVTPRIALPIDTKGNLIDEFSQSIINEASTTATTKTATKPRSAMTAKEKLEAKVAAGKVNENFVRINLKKKVFSRGKKSFNFSRYKKNEWKQKKKGLASSEGSLDLADLAEKNMCFKCGDSGHIGNKCPALKSDELLPLDENEPSDYPTLEEAEEMASKEAVLAHAHRIEKLPKCPSFNNSVAEKLDDNSTIENDEFEYFDDIDIAEELESDKTTKLVGHKIPQDLINILLPPVNGKIDPLYPASADGKIIETPNEVFEALKMFGHKCFRPGQEKAIMRILTGQSTLVTLSTGSGKSLCYQLPAYLYAKRSNCITLVVSPLVSLMDDQVTGIPGFISAAALHTGQTPKVREKIMETIKEGKLDILLVSPEAIVAGEKSTGFGSLLRQLPPIAFVCIDEAHCISQWSHNFRPSYLMICRVLMEKMGVKTILGLTATATESTAESIVSHLRIHDGMHGVISDIPLPDNLTLTVSKDDQRDRALINLLRSKRFEKCDSVIIYCTRRDECTRIAGILRVSLQDTVNSTESKSKAKISPIAEAYHAGLVASRRKIIQKAFMKGDIRIVVATVAFGMGINKSNIRSVIHYNMPSSFEGYVQEVGRAGRDDLPAHCHLFLSPKEDSDKWELRRHIFADGVDRHTIRRLLQKIFISCSCAANGKKCPGHEVAIPIDETVRTLDISEEIISTLLCYLELHPKKFITVLSSVYVNAKVSSYNGPKALKIAAQSSPPLAMAIALNKKNGNDCENSSIIEFPVVDIAATIGWDSGVVKNHLKNLEWIKKSDGKYKRSSISVRYDTLGLRVRAPGDLSDAELDEALDALYERSRSQQTSALQQLSAIYSSLNKYSHSGVKDCLELNKDIVVKSEELKNTIRQYFQSSSPLAAFDMTPEIGNKENEDQIVSDIRSLICSYRDNNFTGRAVARIFHGIQSPNYSALTWSRCRFWRAHLPTDFNWIVQIATREILSMR